MANFITSIILEDICVLARGGFSGRFAVDVSERLNVQMRFDFVVNRFHAKDCNIVIYKKGKVFLTYQRNSKRRSRKKYSEEQQVIYAALNILLFAHLNQLDVRSFAYTKIERYGRLSIKTATLDQMGEPLIRACL